MENIFDTHAHYDDEAFNEDRESVIKDLKENGVCNVINVGADLKSSQNSIDLSKKYDFIYAAVGVHPYDATNLKDDYLDKLKDMCKWKKVVAIGEIGLDYHMEDCNKEAQKKIFKEQIELSKTLDLPIIIHNREAHEDTMNIIKEYKPKGVIHCFSGSKEMAKEVIKLGMYIGLGGVVSFKNAKNAVEVAKTIPIERLILETDAPYMAPVPFRGKRCDSTLIKYTAQKIAEIRNMSLDELLLKTKENAKSLFSI